ncbi:MAG: hypothetical protein R3F49_19690 [Planctomycetota bacterium]
MIVSEKRVLGFAAVGIAALMAVVVLDSGTSWEALDSRTGFERVPGIERLDEARATGDARLAIELLSEAGGLAGPESVPRSFAALALELSVPAALDRDALEQRLINAHTDAPELARAAADAREARAALGGLCAPSQVAGWRSGANLAGGQAERVARAVMTLVGDEVIHRAAAAFFVPALRSGAVTVSPGDALLDAPYPGPSEASSRGGEPIGAAGPSEGNEPASEALAREALALDFVALRIEGEMEDGRALVTQRMLELAQRFGAVQRPRARLRWMARAYAASPERGDIALELAEVLIKMDEAEAARAVLLAATSADTALARRLAELGAWGGLTELELGALEQLTTLGAATEEDRSRLVDLYMFDAQPERARPHAEALARTATSIAGQALPIQLALEVGDVDAALEALALRRRAAPDEDYWIEEELDLLEQDLRFDALEARLRALAAADPAQYEARYELLLRRSWRLEPLLELLMARLARDAGSEADADEALALARHLGAGAVVRSLVERDLAPEGDCVRLISRMDALRRLGLTDLRARLLDRLLATPIDANTTREALEALGRSSYDPALLQRVLESGRQHAGEPEVQLALLGVLDAHDPTRALRFARLLAAQRASDPAAQQRVVERAQWASDEPLELAAREALAACLTDADAARLNDAARATLAVKSGRFEYALGLWRGVLGASRTGRSLQLDPEVAEIPLAWREGALASAALAGRADEVSAFRARYSTGAPDEAQLERAVGLSLFGLGQCGHAAPFLARAADLAPLDVEVALRLGQSLSWSDDPRGARPVLERLLDLPGGATVEARFLLAEVYHALSLRTLAAPLYEQVVQEHAVARLDERLWCARSLVRLGSFGQAGKRAAGLEVLHDLAASSPPTTSGAGEGAAWSLPVEVSEGLLAADEPDEARRVIEGFLALHPNHARAHRLAGRVALALGDRAAAIDSLVRAVELGRAAGAPSDGAELDLARAYDSAGRWRDARAATAAMLRARDSDGTLLAYDQDLGERLADLGGALLRWRGIGDDSFTSLGVFGSTLVADERSRLVGAVLWQSYTGRANAVDNGATDVDASFASVQLAFDRRRAPDQRWAVGLHAFPDAPGAGSLGVWGAYRLEDDVAGRWNAEGRVHLGDLWGEPFAAAGLGGRTDGVELTGFRALGSAWWTSGSARTAEVSIDAPGRGEVSDTLFGARVAVGRVLSAHAPRVAEPTAFDRVGPLGFSPYLDPRAAAGADGDHVQVYVGLDHQSLGGGADLASLLPIAERTSYLLLGGRVDRLIAHEVGGTLEAVAGVELESGDPALSLDAGATWRPSFDLEVLGRVGAGQALGRSGAETELRILLGIQLRR